MEDNSVYYVMFFDKDGKHIGYYGTDIHSGGYPCIPGRINQATQFSDYDSALAIAEGCYSYGCYSYGNYDYNDIHKATICELTLTPKFSTERETVKKQIADRKIKEKLEKIAMLQKEVEDIKKTCKSS